MTATASVSHLSQMSIFDDEHKLDYDLTTSIRYDRSLQFDDTYGPLPFLLLRYHYDRLVQAADLHGWECAKSVLSYDLLKTMCERAVQAHEEASDEPTLRDPYKIRVLLTREGILTATVMPTKPLSSGDPFAAARFKPGTHPDPISETVWSLYLDTESTPISLFTTTKTTHREHYDAARARACLPPFSQSITSEDVLLYNPQGEITETSVSNVALWRDGRWLTPPLEAGCLFGTTRRWLLEQKLIEDTGRGVLLKDTVKPGEYILLFNAVSGCRLGKTVN